MFHERRLSEGHHKVGTYPRGNGDGSREDPGLDFGVL